MLTHHELKKMVEGTRSLRPALSYVCPVGCPICYAPKGIPTKMRPTFFKKLLQQGQSLKFNTVAIGGGEPLVELPLLKVCLQLAKHLDYATAITSSGYGLTSGMLDDLQKAGLDFFQLSLGFNRVCFESVLPLLNASSISFGINFLVAKEHIHDLFQIHRAFEQSRASYVVYILPKTVPAIHTQFNQTQITEYLQSLTIIRKESTLPFLIDCATHAVLTGGTCRGSHLGITVTPTQKISFCAFCDLWVPFTGTLDTTLTHLDGYCTGTCLCLPKFLKVG